MVSSYFLYIEPGSIIPYITQSTSCFRCSRDICQRYLVWSNKTTTRGYEESINNKGWKKLGDITKTLYTIGMEEVMGGSMWLGMSITLMGFKVKGVDRPLESTFIVYNNLSGIANQDLGSVGVAKLVEKTRW